MSRARDRNWFVGPFMGGVTWYPYQIALGATLRYWPCLFAPSVRIHLGPFKVWFGVQFRRNQRVTNEPEPDDD